MLHVEVLKRPVDVVKVFFVAERKMMNFVGGIKLITLFSKISHNVFKSARADLEIAWHSVHLKRTFKMTSLLFIKLFLNSISDASSPLRLLKRCLSAQNLAILVNSMLLEIAHDILLVSSQDVMHIESNDITGHFSENYINVHVDKVISMRHVNH